MIVTEAQAEKLLCPKLTKLNQNVSCVGSQCMWWVWGLEPIPQRRICANALSTVEPHRMVGLPDDWVFVPHEVMEGRHAHWVEPDASAEGRRKGCCGVAHQ